MWRSQAMKPFIPCTRMALLGRMLLILGLLAVGVDSWPHGAPSSACDTMLPFHHGQTPSNAPSPYKIAVSEATYTPGQPITISLLAPTAEPFLGFLFETRQIHGDDIGGYTGSLTPVEGTHNIEGCGPATLTHTDSGQQSFHNLSVIWTPPAQSEGAVVIRATFVKSFSTFWVGVMSPPIKRSSVNPQPVINHQGLGRFVKPDKLAPATKATTRPTSSWTTQNSAALSGTDHSSESPQAIPDGFCKNLSSVIETDVACGRSKGCFVSCDSYSCEYVVTWVSRDDVVEFEITARTRGLGDQWIAIGFSDDIEMGNDSVVECVSENGVVSVYQSFNYVYYNERLEQPHTGLKETTGCLHEGVFWCKFSRIKKVPQSKETKIFDLNEPWIVMFANGDVVDGVKQMHTLSPKYGPWTSGVPVNFEDMAMAGKGAGSRLLINLHGCLMIIAWIICASGGILAARYYRDEWPNITPCGQQMWFMVLEIHRTSLVATFTLVVVAFFIIYEEANRGFGPVRNGYSTGKLYEAVHPTLGIVTFVMTFVNPIMAIFRPKPDGSYRPVFNWAHRCVGVFTFVIALFTIAFGLCMEKVGAPVVGLYVLLGYGVYQCAVAISLEVWGCLHTHLGGGSQEIGDSKDEYESLINKRELRPQVNGDHWLSDFWTWKVMMYGGNMLILMAVAIYLMYLVVAEFP